MRLLPLAALLLALAAPARQAPATYSITNVVLIDGTGAPPRPGTTIRITGNRISAITSSGEVPAGEVIDGAGRFAIPGLWDMHTHLTYLGDVTATTLVAHGVTGVRDMGGALGTIDWLRARIDAGALIGPRIVRAGPLVDGSKPGVPDRLVIDQAADGTRAVAFLAARGVDLIKVHNGAPAPAYFALLAEARRRGIAVAGHIPIDVAPAAAIDAGHGSVEHVVSLFEGAFRRHVAAGMSQDEALAQFDDAELERLGRAMAARGTWFTPTLVTYWYRSFQHQVRAHAAGDPRERYVTASMRRYWDVFAPLPDTPEVRGALARSYDRFVAIAGVLHREGVRFLTGSDLAAPHIYPGSSLHEELGWLVKAGLRPMEAIVAATRNGAEAAGRLDDLGTIEPGKLADLVLLDADPLADIANTQRIDTVVVNGRILRRADLDRLLAGVERQAKSR
ncbi:MAG TPA: amidohydrolase family protein [Vicinamibacterales bacterium]